MRTHGTTSLGVPGWLAVLILGLPLLLVGCAEGIGTPTVTENGQETRSPQARPDDRDNADDSDTSDTSNESNDSNSSNGSNNSRDDDEEPVVYEWGLPSNDSSIGEVHPGGEPDAYKALLQSCSDGAAFLDSDSTSAFSTFESPRNILLFAAGIKLCEGDRDGAIGLFEQAKALGFAGLAPDGWAFCVLYQEVRSVLEQRPPEAFECPGGSAPPFELDDSGIPVDPLNPEEESGPEDGTDPNGESETETDTDPGTEPAP